MLKKFLLSLIPMYVAVATSSAQSPTSYELRSPNGAITVRIVADTLLRYHVLYKNKALIPDATAALHALNVPVLDKNPAVRRTEKRSVRDTIFPVVREKRDRIPDIFEELTLHCAGSFKVIFRAYDDGVAHRFVTDFRDSITISNETAHFRFPDNRLVYYPAVQPRSDADIFHTSFESPYSISRVDTLPAQHLAFSPVLLADSTAPFVVITESDLLDYPGMFLKKQRIAD